MSINNVYNAKTMLNKS